MLLALLLSLSCLRDASLPNAEREELASIIKTHKIAMRLQFTESGVPYHVLNTPARVDELFKQSPLEFLDICIGFAEKGTPTEAINACAVGISAGENRAGIDDFSFVTADEFSNVKLKSGKTERELWTKRLKERRDALRLRE